MPSLSIHKRQAHRVRVMIVEASPVLRQTWVDALPVETSHEIVHASGTLAEAWASLIETTPDVLVIGVDRAESSVARFVRRLMHLNPLPVVLIASSEYAGQAMEALAAGAVAVTTPPKAGEPFEQTAERVVAVVKSASLAGVHAINAELARKPLPSVNVDASSIVAIGSGSGGLRATIDVLSRWPADGPGVVLVQHLPPGFSAAFARKLQTCCAAEVVEACPGDALYAGKILVAPAGVHTMVRREQDRLVIDLKDGPALHRQKPSVDMLFESLARVGRGRIAAAVLTGAGVDGAAGLLRLRKAGARTLAEADATAVVAAMPFAAATSGGAECVVEAADIAQTLLDWSAEQVQSQSA